MKNYASLLIQACNMNYLIMFWSNQQDKKQFTQTIYSAQCLLYLRFPDNPSLLDTGYPHKAGHFRYCR